MDVFTVTWVAVQPTACQVCLTSEQKVAFLRPAITCGWLAPPACPAGVLPYLSEEVMIQGEGWDLPSTSPSLDMGNYVNFP